MTISFIYPSDPFSPRKIDEAFANEAALLKEANFTIHIINTDDIINSKIIPELIDSEELIYRGWMLKKEVYEELYNKVNKQLLTSPENYLYAHHLPNWYNQLKEFTMSSIYGTGEEISKLYKDWGNKPAFVKDYVKSLKTGEKPIVNSEVELQNLVNKMKKYRGFIEGGIVLREPQELLPETETRFFVLKNKIFNKDEMVSPEMQELAQAVVSKVNNLQFFSIDLVKDSSNKIWLVEIGDGQVSDSVGWNQEKFINIFKSIKPKNNYKP